MQRSQMSYNILVVDDEKKLADVIEHIVTEVSQTLIEKRKRKTNTDS